MMFGFLKDKLKQAVRKLSKDVDEQAKEEVIAAPAEATPEEIIEEKEAAGQRPAEESAPPPEEQTPAKEEKEALPKKKQEPAPEEQKEEEPPKPAKEEPLPAAESSTKAEPTSILYDKEVAEPEGKLPAVKPSAEEQTPEVDPGVLEQVEEQEARGEEQKVSQVIESFEEKKESKGIFGRIREAFSKKEERKEEESIVERELLGEGLSEEETAFVEEQTRREEREAPAPTAIDRRAQERAITQEKAQAPAAKEPIHGETAVEEHEEKGGFLARFTKAVTTKTLTTKQFDEIFWDLEVALLEANVAVDVIEKIRGDLSASLVDQKLPRSKIEETITATLTRSVESLFDVPPIDLLEHVARKKPYVIAFFGVNGAGKTTTIAKIAHYLIRKGKSVVLAAGDTFRAAAIQQLEEHAHKLGVKIIRHDYGADAAAVGFDAIAYAKSKGIDAVLIDTAGRLHSNVNLMDELAKIIRVCKPDLRLFVGESITGNDCIEQARRFDDAVGIDGIILTKADVDEKGGAAVSVSYVTKKPILFLGMGQAYDDLAPFEKRIVLDSLGLA